jgi:tetratricopeptide (TPR) repeat protein
MFHYLQSVCYFAKGAFNEAANEAKASIQVKGDEYWSHVALALASCKLGEAVAARAAADRACELLPKLSVAYLQSLLAALHPPYLETWLDTLRKAGMPEQ